MSAKVQLRCDLAGRDCNIIGRTALSAYDKKLKVDFTCTINDICPQVCVYFIIYI